MDLMKKAENKNPKELGNILIIFNQAAMALDTGSKLEAGIRLHP